MYRNLAIIYMVHVHIMRALKHDLEVGDCELTFCVANLPRVRAHSVFSEIGQKLTDV